MEDEEVVEEVAVEHMGGISLRGEREGRESEIVREEGERGRGQRARLCEWEGRERDCERGRGESEWRECEIVREGGESERDSVRELCCEDGVVRRARLYTRVF